jgi:hypothetical protein
MRPNIKDKFVSKDFMIETRDSSIYKNNTLWNTFMGFGHPMPQIETLSQIEKETK